MEIRIDVSEVGDVPICSAYFMFVARDASDYTKSYPIPQLTFDQEDDPEGCLLRQEWGNKNKHRRMEFAAVIL